MRWARFLILLLVMMACGGPPEVDFGVGKPVPSFELPLLGVGKVRTADLNGEPTVINFWATWCQPCLKEIPELIAFAETGEARVLGIALDEDAEKTVGRFVQEHGINYPVAFGDQDVFMRFRGFSIPYTVVLDAGGQAVAIHRGPVTADVLRQDLESLG